MSKESKEMLVPLKEAATYLQISERSAYTLAREDRLAGAVKVGNQWRVDMTALKAWVKAEGHPAPRSPGAAADREGDE